MKILDESLLDFAHRHATDFLSTLPDRHVGARASREELLGALSVPLSEEGEDPKRVLESLASQAERGAVAMAGPRYFGFVIGGALPVTVAADWMNSGGCSRTSWRASSRTSPDRPSSARRPAT